MAFLGTPDVAVGPLRALVDAGHEVVLVVSQPDKRRGRGGALAPSPVKAAALELGLSVTERADDLLEAGAELGVVVAYGRLIRPHVLAVLPMVNLHFSLLPRWRGAAPVERAILAGDAVTGVCIMAVEEGLDTGPVYACEDRAIGEDDTLEELRSSLAETGTRMLLQLLASGLPEPRPQEGEPTYAARIEPEEHKLDWSRSAVELHRVVRLGQAWTTFRGRRLRILRTRRVPASPLGPGELDPARLLVGTGDGALELLEVQPEGKASQAAAAWRNGARPTAGESFI
ncbi:MAG TPA: methionyl-tRNA formyltransferase [Acidimicrobiales bacterium]|nr:methionyl-tRNA formyltransferase [Acidimicrobiales bacterium]